MTLKEHIDDIRGSLETGRYPDEAAVRQGVVLRLLDALDWPIYSPQIVYPQYPVGEGKVDFALCHPESTPLVFIEVKQIGNIEEAEQQLFEYAFHEGIIPIAVLTDGQKWRFFHLMGLEYYRELKVCELDFIKGNSEEIADCLNIYLNYQSIRKGEAIRRIKKDYKRIYKQKIQWKPVPPIPPELHHVIVPPNAEDNEVVFNKTAWKVAHMRWLGDEWRGSVPEGNVGKAIQVIESSLESIQGSDIYEHCVKHLMLTTRTAEEFNKWVCPRSGFYKKNMPERFGRRMRLSPERVQQMVDEIKKEHNSPAQGSNKNA